MGQKIVAFDGSGNITGFYDSVESPVPVGVTNILEISDVEWTAAEASQAHTVVAGTLVPPTGTYLIAKAKDIQTSLLKQEYAVAVSTPVSYMGTIFQSDGTSQTLLNNVIAASGGTLPAGFYWVDAHNAKIPMTFVQLQGLGAAMLAQGWALFQNLQTKKEAVAASSTVQAVQAITF